MFSFLEGPSMIVLREMDILKAKAEFDDIMAMIERAAKDGTRIELVEQEIMTIRFSNPSGSYCYAHLG
jgi:hypothetical protein